MSSVILTGDTSGSVTVTVPAVAGSNTATIGAATGTHYPFTAGTAVTCAGQTSIDFTNIPSWVKRITVMFNGVSISGTSGFLVQLGTSGGIVSSNYLSTSTGVSQSSGTAGTNSTAGFVMAIDNAAYVVSGHMVITLISGTAWISSHTAKRNTSQMCFGGGNGDVGGTLDRVRITTVNGTDTFDTTPSAGTINILYE